LTQFILFVCLELQRGFWYFWNYYGFSCCASNSCPIILFSFFRL